MITRDVSHMQAIPYLPEEPLAGISLDLMPVSYLMKSPVVTFQVPVVRGLKAGSQGADFTSLQQVRPGSIDVLCLQEKMQIKDLRWALRNTTHNGFPVVRKTQHGEVRHLCGILKQFGPAAPKVACQLSVRP